MTSFASCKRRRYDDKMTARRVTQKLNMGVDKIHHCALSEGRKLCSRQYDIVLHLCFLVYDTRLMLLRLALPIVVCATSLSDARDEERSSRKPALQRSFPHSLGLQRIEHFNDF